MKENEFGSTSQDSSSVFKILFKAMQVVNLHEEIGCTYNENNTNVAYCIVHFCVRNTIKYKSFFVIFVVYM